MSPLWRRIAVWFLEALFAKESFGMTNTKGGSMQRGLCLRVAIVLDYRLALAIDLAMALALLRHVATG